MTLKLVRHQKVTLKGNPDFSEVWLHDQICNELSILGLGNDLDIIERERRQFGGGRLDLLLADSENGVRYEVEIMLGATDPNHIIRCIEYWDIERRRYPAYEHVAVLVAEEITTRFLNVLALFAGNIPLVAIQLNALQVGDSVVLNFTKILDQRVLREDDVAESEGDAVDRHWWEGRKGAESVNLCDRMLELAKSIGGDSYQLRFGKSTISLGPAGSFFNIAQFWPKQKFVHARFKVADGMTWTERFSAAGLDAHSLREDRVQLRIAPADFTQHESLFRELLTASINESEL
jgi:hypothetical protein